MRYLLMVLALLASPVWAVQPDEILSDTVMETRARDLSAGLRCPVCRNESIDESNAGVSRDLRILLRDRLVAGDSDDEALAFLVDRYGEYILLRPTTDGANIILWLAGPILLLLAGAVGFATVRGRSKATGAAELSKEEQDRLKELLGD